MNDVTRTSKEKLPDWLRRWYALKGEPRFREAADEIERLQKLVEHDDEMLRERNSRVALLESLVNRTAPEPLPDYRAAMKAAECDEGIDCDTFIRVLQKKVADQQRELARLQRPAQPPCDDLKEATRLLHVVNAWFWRSSDDPDSARVDPLYPARGTSCSKAPLFSAIRALLDRYPYGGATSTKGVDAL
jgi:hypothetical protein